MNTPNVLIVEDDRELREALCTTLKLAGMKYFEADCAENALVALDKRNFDIVVSDVNMPGMSGHELLAQVKSKVPGLPMMLITAFGQIKDAVDAMQAGADDYLVKPFEPQTLIDSIEKIVGANSNTEISEAPVAKAEFTKEFFRVASKVAKTESTVMISGESGTGKEVLARYIHNNSPRKNKPFVAINCAAIPENMLEAMLFGHEKGAFTGAYNSSPGKFEQANGGTLLLDEVSEMDLGLQAKLLRVLQEREVERVGGKKPIKLDVRVLATTNRALKSYVDAGKFREDLFYRLSVFPMAWKPLRERPDDILPIAEKLLQVHATKMRRGPVSLNAECKAMLLSYPWPGNVRELDNAVQRSLILAEGNTIKASDFILDMPESTGVLPTNTAHEAASTSAEVAVDDYITLDEDGTQACTTPADSEVQSLNVDIDSSALGKDLKLREYQIIIDTLRDENGKKKQTAERLGISPRTLRYKLAQMRDLGIDIASEMAA